MPREKRRTQRHYLRLSACAVSPTTGLRECMVRDISETGARLDVHDSSTMPDHFVLMLSRNGARRYCAVMWRRANEVGVRFARSLAEAKASTLVAAADAAAQAAPSAVAAAPADTGA